MEGQFKGTPTSEKRQSGVGVLLIMVAVAAFIGYLILRIPGVFDVVMPYVRAFALVVVSILLEAIPFVLLGAFIASLIHIFVSEAWLAGIIPKNRWLGLLIASFMGFVFPVCECAIVPIMRRLVKKGMPLHIALTFMLAVPIVNPVVLMSTYYAFSGSVEMVLLRGGLGVIAAIGIGHIGGRLSDRVPALKEARPVFAEQAFVMATPAQAKRGKWQQLGDVLAHTAGEFYDVGRFLIAGAMLSALMQVFVPKHVLLAIGGSGIGSIAVMMLLAFVLSLCSEADAFIARTFAGQFTTGAIVGFLILGPMLDIKNTLMLAGTFKPKYLALFMLTITLVCGLLAYGVNLAGL